MCYNIYTDKVARKCKRFRKRGFRMPGSININQSDVTNYSSGISGSVSGVGNKTLSSIDTESTIAGNIACQEAFANSQQMLMQLVAVIESEAQKISALGDEFSSADQTLSEMVKRTCGK